MTLAIGLYFILAVGPWVAVILAIGVYAGVFYTIPPLATGYRPFVGEWLTALPALVALPVGAYYILTRGVAAAVVVAAVVHGILCIARLMNHHIPDMAADAAARPRKVTSVLWVREHIGPRYVPWLGALYFLIAAAVAGLGGLLIAWPLAIPIPFATASAALAATADPSDPPQVTRRELWISLLIVASAAALVAAFGLGG
jgi:1,4-dihydroxy-2-naphthoate octaprenyltransferase